MTSMGSFLLLVILIYKQNYNEIWCVEETVELCFCSQGSGDVPQDTPVQSKELGLIILYKSHGKNFQVKDTWLLGECIANCLKNYSAEIVGGGHLGEGTGQVFCLEILDVPAECSCLQHCSCSWAPKQRDKYHGRAFSSGRGTVLSKAISFSLHVNLYSLWVLWRRNWIPHR